MPDEVATDSDGSSEDQDEKKSGFCLNAAAAWVSIAFGLMAIAMATATVLIELWRRRGLEQVDQASAGSLAGLLLFGVLTFFFGIASLIALFRALDMQSKDTALGLPQGSIRAYMALVLIMLFFLMAVFLYIDVARTGTERRVIGVTQESYDQLVEGGEVISAFSYLVSDPKEPEAAEVRRWDVVLRSARERSEVSEEMARQLITVLGTLIVAIAAFYFGTNSVQGAWRAENEGGPKPG